MATKKLDNELLDAVADLQKRSKESTRIVAVQSTAFAKVQYLT